jgi:peroxiredoxin Q/BCP
MAQLRQDYDQFTARDAEIVTIGPENAAAFRKYWAENKMPFVGLPDPDHSVLKLYGQQVSLFKLGRMPAQMIIDKSGTLRYIHYGHSMQDIPENAELLELLDQINSV